MKHLVSILLPLALLAPYAMGQDLQTRSLRMSNAGVRSTLLGSPTGGTFTLPSTAGTLITSEQVVLYGPIAQQTSVTDNTKYLLDVAYDASTTGTTRGARITSQPAGLGIADALGLTVTASAPAVAGSNALGLDVHATALMGVNTIARFTGENGIVSVNGRDAALSSAAATLSLSGARSTVAPFASIDFMNFDENGAALDQTVARIEARRTATNSGALLFYTGTSTVNTVPSLSLLPSGRVGIHTDDARTMLDVHGDIALRMKSGTVVLSAVDNTIDATGVSFITVAADAAGTIITDITGGTDGKVLYLYNLANNLTVANDAGTSASDGIRTMTGGSITTSGMGSLTLVYQAAVARWIVMSFNP